MTPQIFATMIDDHIREYLLPEQFNAAVRAGAAIMKIYKSSTDYDVTLRSDHTPITIADRMAHDTIKRSLGRTRIPILSEEGRTMLYEERCNWELFWLVDPLDGTVEFIKGNNEFTVNIALMENNVCVSSVVYVQQTLCRFALRNLFAKVLRLKCLPIANIKQECILHKNQVHTALMLLKSPVCAVL